jgi:Protein of unknown function (DUF4232)
MGSVMVRLLVIVATLLGIVAGSSRAWAQPVAHGLRPICLSGLTVRSVMIPANDPHAVTVVLARSAGPACVVANYPQPASDGGAVPPTPLVVGRLSLAASATAGGGTTAAFVVRFATIPAPSSPDPTPTQPGTCVFGLLVNGVVVKGQIPLPASCSSLAEVDVSSFATGTAPPEDALATPAPNAAKNACRPQDLALRDAGADPSSDATRERYALQNVGLGPCRISGWLNAVLRDANGAPIVLQVAPRNKMAMLLALARGHEASFTIAYPGSGGPNGEQRCVAAQTIAVTIAGATTPLVAPTRITPCPPATGPGMRISNLQLGVPLPR